MSYAREGDSSEGNREPLAALFERVEDLASDLAAVTADLANAASWSRADADATMHAALRDASVYLMRAMLALRPHLSSARDLLERSDHAVSGEISP